MDHVDRFGVSMDPELLTAFDFFNQGAEGFPPEGIVRAGEVDQVRRVGHGFDNSRPAQGRAERLGRPQPGQPPRERERLLAPGRVGRGIADVQDTLGRELAVAEFGGGRVAQSDEHLSRAGAHERRERLAQVTRLGSLTPAVVRVTLEATVAGVAMFGHPERASRRLPKFEPVRR